MPRCGPRQQQKQTATAAYNLFRPGSYLNTGKYLRIGFGKHDGQWVFRAGGKFIEKLGFQKGKLNMFKFGDLQKGLKDLLGL